MSFPSVSVVIPALNEGRNITHVFARIPPDLHQVILVDGQSADNTVEVARNARPDVLVVNQTRTGKGNALACGFEAATGDVIAMLDADGSTDPGELPRFVETLVAGADFAKGTRFAPGGGSGDITSLRRSAPPSGDKLWGDGFEVETLIHVRVAKASLKVAEVPSYQYSRLHGLSNLNATTDGLRVLRTMLAEWRGGPAPRSRRGAVTTRETVNDATIRILWSGTRDKTLTATAATSDQRIGTTAAAVSARSASTASATAPPTASSGRWPCACSGASIE